MDEVTPVSTFPRGGGLAGSPADVKAAHLMTGQRKGGLADPSQDEVLPGRPDIIELR